MDDEVESQIPKEVLEAMARAQQNEVTEDLGFAIAKESEDWEVQTGRLTSAGSPIAVKVVVKDPKRPDLAIQYQEARSLHGSDEAAFSLCKLLVTRPAELKEKKTWDSLASAFKSNLTLRLLAASGVSGDFFAAQMLMSGSQMVSHLFPKSSTPLPPTTDKTPKPSEAGAVASSETPGFTPSANATVSVPMLSST